MIYIFSQPLFYCPATGENPQVHRPYGVLCALKLQKGFVHKVPATILTALGRVGLQPLKNLRSLREYWKAPRRQPTSPALMYAIYQEAR